MKIDRGISFTEMTNYTFIKYCQHLVKFSSFLRKMIQIDTNMIERPQNLWKQADMGLVIRKSVFMVFDQVRYKSTCTAIEDGYRIVILDFETKERFYYLGIQIEGRVMQLIRGLAFRKFYTKSRFSYDAAQIVSVL